MLINLRNALMAGKRLPYDAEVEYLESTGTQYVNTGVPAANNIAFEGDFYISLASFTTQIPFGAKAGPDQNDAQRALLMTYNSQKWIYLQRAAYGYSGRAQKAITADGWHYFYLSATTATIDDVSNTGSWPVSPTNTEPIFIFAFNNNGVISNYATVRCGGFRIYVDGVLVRDYIPVRKGTVGYLYDRVSGKLFGNAGTGDFVLGPDVVPVEYIESHGTEYIVTPKILNSNTEEGAYIEVDVRPQAQAQSQYGVIYSQGSGVFGSPLSILANRGDSTITAFLTGVGETAMSTTGDRIKVRVEHESSNKWGIFANGTRVGGANMSGSYTFGNTSFGAFNAGASKVASGTRFYSVSSSAYNLRAVRVGTGSTWEGAMMDTITRRIYRNAGTGAFGYGNDLKYPIPAE